jgi:hypothetical protein
MLKNKTLKIDSIKLIFLVTITMMSFKTIADTKKAQLSEKMDIEIYYETSSGLSGLTENGYYNFNTGDDVTFYLTENKKIKILKLNKKLTNSKNTNFKEVVFQPLDKTLTNYVVQKADKNGDLCFYDVSKYSTENYTGPIGETYYKVTAKGIYEYPSIGDDFTNCERKPSTKKSVSFEPIDDFSRFEGGILGCALRGCSIKDLNGYSLTAYAVENKGNEKYRSVAMHYDQDSKILVEKSKGIGKQDGISHLNLAEYLWLTPLKEDIDSLKFNGLWRYREIGQKEIKTGCILIKGNQVFESSENSNCINSVESYTINASEKYIDMWWIKNEGATATIAQVNAAVKYKDQNNIVQYTEWEYFPISDNLESAPLYKYSYNPNEIKNKKKEIFYITTFERVK